MLNKDRFCKLGLTAMTIVGLLFVLFFDDSSSMIQELSTNGSDIFTDSEKFFLPEAKLFFDFLNQLVSLITTA